MFFVREVSVLTCCTYSWCLCTVSMTQLAVLNFLMTSDEIKMSLSTVLTISFSLFYSPKLDCLIYLKSPSRYICFNDVNSTSRLITVLAYPKASTLMYILFDNGGESFVVRKQYHPIKGDQEGNNYRKARYQ